MSFFKSRRLLGLGAVFCAVVGIGFGAHAALSKLGGEAAAIGEDGNSAVSRSARVALVIGNSNYPDADGPVGHSVSDARSLASTLRQDGYDVDLLENATRADFISAIAHLQSKVARDATVMVYFAGIGIQSGRESFMIPVDASIWSEADVRREGTSIERVLKVAQEQGAKAKLVMVEASYRNPYERRFRVYSHGLGQINAADTMVLSSVPAGQVESSGDRNSMLMSQFLTNYKSGADAEAVFTHTRNAVRDASKGAPAPALSSSVAGVVRFGQGTLTSTADRNG